MLGAKYQYTSSKLENPKAMAKAASHLAMVASYSARSPKLEMAFLGKAGYDLMLELRTLAEGLWYLLQALDLHFDSTQGLDYEEAISDLQDVFVDKYKAFKKAIKEHDHSLEE